MISTPSDAPTPVPTITAVGVARPRAQGQAMTMTDIPNWSASSKLSMEDGIQDSGYPWNFPAKNQANQVENESIMTCGEKEIPSLTITSINIITLIEHPTTRSGKDVNQYVLTSGTKNLEMRSANF